MAQTKRKRKHRGTQAGTVERARRDGKRGGSGAAGTRVQAKEMARERRAARLDKEPTWRGAVMRAALAAAFFVVAVIVLFDESPLTAVALGCFTFAMYIPMSYFTDRLIYRRRQKMKAQGRR
jgi:hypothetical protein